MKSSIKLEGFYTPEEVATIIKTDVDTVLKMLRSYGMPVQDVNEIDDILIPKSSLELFINYNTTEI